MKTIRCSNKINNLSKNSNWKKNQLMSFKSNRDSYHHRISSLRMRKSLNNLKLNRKVVLKKFLLQLKRSDQRQSKWSRRSLTKTLSGYLLVWQSLSTDRTLVVVAKVNLLRIRTRSTWRMRWKHTIISWRRLNFSSLILSRIICTATLRLTLCGSKTEVAESARCRLRFNSSSWHADTRCSCRIQIRSLMSQVLTLSNKFRSSGVVEEPTVILSPLWSRCSTWMNWKAGLCLVDKVPVIHASSTPTAK